jgi:hypothetical protein
MQDFRIAVGVAFAAFLVLFLVIAFFRLGRISHGQWAILRFLCALCAGGSGAFLTGEAVFSLSGEVSAGISLAVSGTAGVALFLVVWYGFEKFVDEPPDSFTFSIGKGWTFKKAADALAQLDSAVVEFNGFADEEPKASLQERQIRVTSVAEALVALRSVSSDTQIRSYIVAFSPPTYSLTIDQSI